ncbi:hypothetical protein EJ08DRAFT_590456 [Tothia fuscella]|uniref:MPN domain-containing protein n=1 Tax=Tothia fuscella TaxID=1048955 RepID=A0A9P4NPD2_9PEZI|nr:hypothetical protein EJ08DRAFT_590456 [Tothia fuscella]
MALVGAASHGFGKEPLSVKGISEEAISFEYNPDIPLRYWLRTADAIQKQAQSYDRDGNEQDAYLFYLRHATLLLDKLGKHPELKAPGNQATYMKATKGLAFNLNRMESLKPAIEQRHEQYVQAAARRKAEREEWLKSRPQTEKPLEHDRHGDGYGDGDMGGSRKRARRELHAGDGSNRSLALSLAQKDQKKRRVVQRHQDGQGREDDSRPVDEDEKPSKDQDPTDDLARQIIAAGKRGESTYIERNGTFNSHGTTFTPRNFNYPIVPHKRNYDLNGKETQPSLRDSQSTLRSNAPARPPKEYFNYGEPPSRPPKERDWSTPLQPQPPTLPSKDLIAELPADPIPRATTQTPDINSSDYTFTPTCTTESGSPLRTVFLPPTLRSSFLNLAHPNTTRDLETCGILCGTLISNAFFISKLVIPEQEATANTCDTVNEEALFEYCDRNDLMTLGWIHTHPSQTCFMSSRDLHTHAGYQVQMAESVAIVCAPRDDPPYGVFRLTDPPGLKTILNCRLPGIFHPHEGGRIYTDASKPGHVWELPGLEFEVVDLRPGK